MLTTTDILRRLAARRKVKHEESKRHFLEQAMPTITITGHELLDHLRKKLESMNKEPEELAKAFCEASGVYKWEDTPQSMKDWYLQGIDAVVSHILRNPNP
jgi:hypothetical protein